MSHTHLSGSFVFIICWIATGIGTGFYLLRREAPYGRFSRKDWGPNLLGEIVEWGGYSLLTWSAPALAFFVWTFANLLPRAIANHRWYKRQFPDYPADRKILVPFVW